MFATTVVSVITSGRHEAVNAIRGWRGKRRGSKKWGKRKRWGKRKKWGKKRRRKKKKKKKESEKEKKK